MQYELQKLERMSLDEVREIAVSMGLSPRRSQSIREISYAILDAQADNRAAVVQAKEDAREAAGKPSKRERVRGVKRTVAKVITEGARSERVIATVGSEKEQMEAMQEQLKANNHRPNKTVVAAKPLLNDAPEVQAAAKAEKPTPTLPEGKEVEKAAVVEAPVVEQPKKKRGRPKKSETAKPQNEEPKAEQPKAEQPGPERLHSRRPAQQRRDLQEAVGTRPPDRRQARSRRQLQRMVYRRAALCRSQQGHRTVPDARHVLPRPPARTDTPVQNPVRVNSLPPATPSYF